MKLLILIVCFIFVLSCSDVVPPQALGTLERDRIVFKATVAETVVDLPLRESSLVNIGDILVKLDDTLAQNQLANAEANLANVRALQKKLRRGARAEDIAASRAQLDLAEAKVVQADKTFVRITSLVSKKLAGQAELDSARAQRDSARADVRKAEQGLLALTNGTRPEDLEQIDAQVDQAEAMLRLEQHKLDQLTIRATRNGTLDRLPKYLGERVNVGEPVAVVLAGGAPYARVFIPEPVRSQFRAGQTLNVHVDGQKSPIAGTVRWISQDPAFTPYFALNSTDRPRLVYLAEIDLPESAKDLPSGIPVQVDLTESTKGAATP